ncbi:MAG TPA: response regulator [Methylobacter sp.]
MDSQGAGTVAAVGGACYADLPKRRRFFRSLEDEKPACLVLDLCMMPMNGFAVLDRLAQLNIKLPVIVITSDDKEETYERAINKGITAFLRKPIDDQVLLDAINDAVCRSAC